jgi:protein-disulfide isomerase
MHDRIFANQAQMSAETYLEYARQLGLDLERFRRDVEAAETKQRIDNDTREAGELGVTGTPGFFINGKFLSGAQPFERFKELIDAELGPG